MSDTPRTDELHHGNIASENAYGAMVEHAQELERELASARSDVQTARAAQGDAVRRLSEGARKLDAYTATFQVKEKHNGAMRLIVTDKNGDCYEFDPQGERGNRVLRCVMESLK